MKILFPKNIEKGLFSTLGFNFGVFRITLIQLIILTIGAAGSFAMMNSLIRSGMSKGQAMVFSSPILGLFIFIAFFKISEMNLFIFIIKLIRTYFLDSPEKFQVNYPRIDSTEVLIKKAKNKDAKEEVQLKKQVIKKDLLKQLEEDGLI